ncbi:hypothetical protein Z042_23240 [Chania multitudinisentens RB-25]|uniref:Uncharacterized protein n=1 Tax=Chania multitudinisentens RB-25 TaxID=1441930 RepID=W0LIB8_9GAMM|nr:hypothetical protein [Chania multitudinisentens]AHG22199.1 hypothetical protein Z042_23240 [Chania multitudinisentens RB-25]
MGVQGLADGFLAGFNTADAAISRNKEMGLRDAAFQHQVKDSDRNFSLRQADFDYGKERDQREFGYKQERDKVSDQQFGQKLALDQQQVGISRAGLGLRAQELGMRQKEYNYKMMQEDRNQRLQNEMPIVQTFYKQLEETGKVDPELYSQISKDNPLNPSRFFGQDAINNVMEINHVMPKVLSGDVNYNEPKVIKLMDSVLSTDIRRGIGEVDPQTGKKIVGKELRHIGVSEDGQFIIPSLTVKYDDGTSARKPMTHYGSADLRDDQVAQIPVANIMDKIRGYSQMVGQLNQPARVEFLNNMINPPDKAAVREESKGFRRDMLEVGKARAKALAGAEPENIPAINAQYDQLQNQVLQSYGQDAKSLPTDDPAYQAFSAEYQQTFKEAPDMTKQEDIQAFQSWKNQKGSAAPSGAGETPQQLPESKENSHTAQQLREFRRLSQGD